MTPQWSLPLDKSTSSDASQNSKKNTDSKTKKDRYVKEGDTPTIVSTQNSNGVRAIIAHLESTGLTSNRVKRLTTIDNPKETFMEKNTHLVSSGSLSLSSGITQPSLGGSQKEFSLYHQTQVDVRVDGVSLSNSDGNSLLTMDPRRFNLHSLKRLQAIPITLTEGILNPSKHSAIVFHESGTTGRTADSSFTMANFRSKHGRGFRVGG